MGLVEKPKVSGKEEKMAKQAFSLDLLRSGFFILFRHEKGLFGNLIVKAQKRAGFSNEDSQYTHIAVIGVPPYIIDVVPPRIKIVNVLEKYAGRHARIMCYRNSNYEQTRVDVAWWATTHTNLSYDKRGVLNFIFFWIKQRVSHWFCSENGAWALQKKHPKAQGELLPDKTMPAHFFNPKYFSLKWEGVLE